MTNAKLDHLCTSVGRRRKEIERLALLAVDARAENPNDTQKARLFDALVERVSELFPERKVKG